MLKHLDLTEEIFTACCQSRIHSEKQQGSTIGVPRSSQQLLKPGIIIPPLGISSLNNFQNRPQLTEPKASLRIKLGKESIKKYTASQHH